MDFHTKQLKTAGLWEHHPRFMIKTTPSALAWDQWAAANGVNVINVPVGFKAIAAIMKKIERQICDAPDASVVIQDVYGETISLGVQPRLIFAGEESGGMITGPEELIQSHGGRTAIAMRVRNLQVNLWCWSQHLPHIANRRIYLCLIILLLFSLRVGSPQRVM